jgi:sulfatase maturation enzyme AslB (radical SAM superfamily)
MKLGGVYPTSAENCLDENVLSNLPTRIDNPLLSKELVFLVTTQCNIKCSYCYNFYNKSPIHMPPDLAVSFLKDYLKYDVDRDIDQHYQFVFSGGEPTINPEAIFSVVDYADKAKIDFLPTLLTHGILSEKLLEQFIERNFLFQLSYDGGNNNYRQTVSGKMINQPLQRAFERIAKSGLPIVLRATITQANIDHMTDIIHFAKQHSVGFVMFDTCDFSGNAIEYEVARARAQQYVDAYFEAIDVAGALQIEVAMPELMRFKLQGRYQQMPKVVLLPDGTLTTTTRYLSAQAAGVKKSVIGHVDIDQGIQLDQGAIHTMVSHSVENLERHCVSCQSYIYCRGRNQNLQLFREEIAEKKDEYRCEISLLIYHRLAKHDKEVKHAKL